MQLLFQMSTEGESPAPPANKRVVVQCELANRETRRYCRKKVVRSLAAISGEAEALVEVVIGRAVAYIDKEMEQKRGLEAHDEEKAAWLHKAKVEVEVVQLEQPPALAKQLQHEPSSPAAEQPTVRVCAACSPVAA